jgi:hypothetical protein
VLFPGATVDLHGEFQMLPRMPDGLPGARYAAFMNTSSPDGTIRIIDSAIPAIHFDPKAWTVELRVPSRELQDGVEQLYLAQGLAEGHRQKSGMFMMHAAATVDPRGEGHLLVGVQGSGKTATLLALCFEQQHRIVGNDLVIIDQVSPTEPVRIHVGSTYLHIRETAVQANRFLRINALQSRLETRPDLVDLPSFMKKVRVDSQDIGIAVAAGVFPLKHVWHIWLDGTNKQEPMIARQSRGANSLFFSERLGRHISGIVSPIKGRDGRILLVPPSFDSQPAWTNRVRMANHLAGICHVATGPDGATVASLIGGHTA